MRLDFPSPSENVSVEFSEHHSDQMNVPDQKRPCATTVEDIIKVASLGICRLLTDVSLPQTKVEETIKLCENLILLTTQHLQQETILYLQSINNDTNSDGAMNFLNKFQLPDLFTNVSTRNKQAKYLEEMAITVPKPEEKMLSYREDVRHIDGQHKVIRVNETFSYIPIIDTLKLILRNPETRRMLKETEHHHPSQSSSTTCIKEYSSFCSGETYKNSDYFTKFPDAVRLSLYQDDVELGNALSSRAGINKVSCIDFKIQNFPDKYNSSPRSIFPVIFCTSLDAKQHGYNKILQPLISDLKKLEQGVTVYYGSEKYVIRAVLTVFCGDTLAAHEVFNLLGPGANMFCRICTISRPLYKEDTQREFPLRTRQWYESQMKLLEEGQISLSECGLKVGGCILNELENFHITENFALDVMHDVAEGIVPLTVQLVLSTYTMDKNVDIDVSYINYRINSFAYGYVDRKNKPSANFTNDMLKRPNTYKLKQTATQNLLLLRAFPFLFGHKIPSDCQYMLMIGHLINITRILTSPIISDHLLAELEEHIRLYQQLFYTHFNKRINKSHHLEHYVHCIRQSGNMKQFSCFAFEQKNKAFKNQSATCRNFKNICKSLAKRQSFNMVINLLDNPFTDKIAYKTGTLMLPKNSKSRFFLEGNDEPVFVPKSVTINGIEFRPNLVVICKKPSMDLFPLFVVIKEIVVVDNQIHFLVQEGNTTGYNEFLQAYEVEIIGREQFVNSDEIHNHTTFTFWTPYNSQNKFISRRFYCRDN